ncbi:MAG: 2Fe-2S iron-sulfur cluster-binding protein [Thermoplasmata archaeon]|nr:2Fe-2S iron-sulfur cluster-binding protein [Thermoplasmata archaeon]
MSENSLGLSLNGKPRHFEKVPDAERLLDTIRWRAGLKGTKEGCRTGDCGACMVLVNGEPTLSCLVLSREVAEEKITTIEGLSTEKVGRLVIAAFEEAGAVQCGYCTPGFVVALAAQLGGRGPPPPLETLLDGLEGNLCRCTGYLAIQKAVAAAREAI